MSIVDLVTMSPREVFSVKRHTVDTDQSALVDELRSIIKKNRLETSSQPVYIDQPGLMEALKVVTQASREPTVVDDKNLLATMVAQLADGRVVDVTTFLLNNALNDTPDHIVRQARELAAIVSSGSDQNYYMNVDGVNYDHKLMRTISEATGVNSPSLINEHGLGPILDAVLDGGKVTPTEKATLRAYKHLFTPRAWSVIETRCGIETSSEIRQAFARAIVKLMYDRNSTSTIRKVCDVQEELERRTTSTLDLLREIADISTGCKHKLASKQATVLNRGLRTLQESTAGPQKSTSRVARDNVPHVTVYGKSGCDFCLKAKSMLATYNGGFTYKHVDTRPVHHAVGAYMKVPQVFVANTFIGGSDQLGAYLKTGTPQLYGSLADN